MTRPRSAAKAKKHQRPIPPNLLRQALEVLGYTEDTDDPQQALIDLVDNYRLPQELHDRTQLPLEDCRRILHLRDLATGGHSKSKN